MKVRSRGWCSIIGLGVAAALLATAAASAQAPAPDVGLITQLSGAVTYWNQEEQKEPVPAKAFMKVRQGDNFKLNEAASLTFLYFASGRHERWKGPGTIVAGITESTTAGGQQPPSPPEVKLLPLKASRQMAGAPSVIPPANLGKSGVIQTMVPTCPASEKAPAPVAHSPEAQRKIKEAEKLYQELKKGFVGDDVTPELYLFGVLAEYRQFPKMAEVVDAMLQKRPGDATLKELKACVRAQAIRGK